MRTRNARLTAIRALFAYAAYRQPEQLPPLPDGRTDVEASRLGAGA